MASGEAHARLTTFLYLLAEDHLPFGTLGELLEEVESIHGSREEPPENEYRQAMGKLATALLGDGPEE